MRQATHIAGVGAIAFAAASGGALAQGGVEFEATDLGGGLYTIEGVGGFGGGNIGLWVGEDGVILIDDSMPPLSDKLIAAIRDVAGRDADYVINTHVHGDHVGGNEALAQSGAVIVAHDNLRKRLVEDGLGVGRDQNIPAAKAMLPVITFSKSMTFHLNDTQAHVFHVETAHTDGDAVIHFPEQNVIHAGDTLFNGVYPFVDVDTGGHIDGFIAAQERIYALADDDTKIIAGHGPLASKADLKASIDMLSDLRARVAALIDDGMSLEDVVAANPSADYSADWTWGFINDERIVTAIYRSLAGE